MYKKDANFEEGESVGGSREKESRYGNKMEANRETTFGVRTNTMDIDIKLEPGLGGADKDAESKSQAGSVTKIPKRSSVSMKVLHDKFQNTNAGHDIGFLAAEFPSQSDGENYVTRGHIDFPLTLPKDDKNLTFPMGILKFRNINAEQHNRDWLVWNQHSFNKVSLFTNYYSECTIICIFSADCGVHETGLLVYIVCVENCAHNRPENLPGNHCTNAKF